MHVSYVNVSGQMLDVLIDPVDIHLKRQVRLVYDSNMNSAKSSIQDDYKKEAPEEGKGFLGTIGTSNKEIIMRLAFPTTTFADILRHRAMGGSFYLGIQRSSS